MADDAANTALGKLFACVKAIYKFFGSSVYRNSRGQPMQTRHFWLQGSKGRCHGNQFFGKIGQNHKNGHNFSCKRHIHALFRFEIGFVLSANLCYRRIHLWHSRIHKRQRGVTMATNFGTKIAINTHKCISTRDNENVIAYNMGISWSTNPKKIFLIARV